MQTPLNRKRSLYARRFPLDSDAVERLLVHLPYEARCARWSVYAMLTWVAATVLLCCLRLDQLFQVASLAFTFSCCILTAPYAVLSFSRYTSSLRALQELDDVRAVTLLAEALTTIPTDIVLPALTRLLPRLRADDACLLDARHRACLNRRIVPGEGLFAYDKPLAIAYLKALEQIGDRESLPYVQRAADTAPDRDVRFAAHECLFYLQERIHHVEESQTLLRAVAFSQTPSGDLLRPATSLSNDPPELLLRSVPQDNDLPAEI